MCVWGVGGGGAHKRKGIEIYTDTEKVIRCGSVEMLEEE